MKKAALFVGGLCLTALMSTPAMAEVVRVKIMARVSQVNDTQGRLNGKIIVGQRLSGTYVYNTNTPDQSPEPNWGVYRAYANEARIRLVAGGLVFENNQPTQEVYYEIEADGSGYGSFTAASRQNNKPLSNGEPVGEILVQYQGMGSVTQSTALPTVAPDVNTYDFKEVYISGGDPFGAVTFQVAAQIESAELIVADSIGISPAAGSFLPGQHFDAGLTLPRNSTVVNVIAKANGAPLPIGYPGLCTLVPPPNNAAQPAVLCPNAQAVLPQAAGAPIEWTVELSNGTILTESANWTLQQ